MARLNRNFRSESHWRELMSRHAESGLSVRAFCAREGVSECGFYWWRRELRLRDQAQAGTPVEPMGKPITASLCRGKSQAVTPVAVSRSGDEPVRRRKHVVEGGPRLRDRSQARAPSFVPVTVSSVESIVIELRSGQVLRLPELMAIDRVVQLVRAMEVLA